MKKEFFDPVHYDPEESSSNAEMILFRGPEPQKVAELLTLSLIQPRLDFQPQWGPEQLLGHRSALDLIHHLFLKQRALGA